MNLYYSQCQPRRKSRKAPIAIGLAIASTIALYGWMGKRDAEPKLPVVTYDCAPAMEMDMPIQAEMVQL